MRLRRHGELLRETMRHGALRTSTPILPRCLPTLQCLFSSPTVRYSSTAYPERIAILGGGVAGLSSAYFVSREFPNSKIVLYEAGKDIGGWIKSKRVGVPGGDVVFELGPRTLRSATPTAHLIQELDLVKDMTWTWKHEPAAKNRYIYYPDRLNRLPAERPGIADVVSLWRSGILAGVLGMLKEPMVPKRPDGLTDETVGSFLARRVDARIANNLVSAVFHGIYAGDIWQLSAKTLLSLAWQLEGRYGSALGGYFKMQSEDQRPVQLTLAHPYDVDTARALNEEVELEEGLAGNLREASTFTFKGGLQILVDTLKSAVLKTGNVEVQVDSPVQATKPVGGESMQVAVTTGVRSTPSAFTLSPQLTLIHSPPPTPPPTKPPTTTSSSPPSATLP
jgi:oxygen-dependent protoporphyrinogen oxidase